MTIPIGARIDRKTGAITPLFKEATTEEVIGYADMLKRVAGAIQNIRSESAIPAKQ